MPVFNQPFQGAFGSILINELANNYTSLTIFSAFAKNSGVLRIKEAVDKFRSVHGRKVSAFIGVDLDGTSYEALTALFYMCDDLYVIHSENAVTYHSKIYLLESPAHAWLAVGSNNLTGGGLWTNFESAFIQEFDSPGSEDLEQVHILLQKYTDPDYPCSFRIKDIDDIETLLHDGYINKEMAQVMKRRKEKKTASSAAAPKIFGAEKTAVLPHSIDLETVPCAPQEEITRPNPAVPLTINLPTPSFCSELFWFEMRASTGGSRNILDLSKQGRIMGGSAENTPYAYPEDPSVMYGGVKFFDIDPEDTDVTKNIYVHFKGKDYFPSTIKFAPDNGSWRIQLTGTTKPDDKFPLSRFGNENTFVNQILVFEKLRTNYYSLYLLDASVLPDLKSQSIVWACNGSNPASKAYGML